MRIKSFLRFIKWYFRFTGEKTFTDSAPKIRSVSHVRKKERLYVIIFAYLLTIVSVLLFLTIPYPRYLLAVALLLTAIGCLSLCQFSLIYYFILYTRYSCKDMSINDSIIVDECILLNPANNIRKIISNIFHVVDVRGNIFALKFDLSGKKKRTKLAKNDIITLTFKPNAVLLNGKKAFAGKLLDLSDLEELLCEAQKLFDPKV